MLTASLGPTPATRSGARRGPARRGEEAEEGERVLAHVGVDAQADLGRLPRPADRRSRPGWPRGSRRRPRPPRPPGGSCAGRGRAGARSRGRAPRVGRACRWAWQRATARASAASPAAAVARQLEERGHHQRDLRLLGAAEARDLHLDRGRGKGGDGQPRLRAGQEDHAAHVAEDEGAAGVDGVEDVLHGQDVRAQARDDLADARRG